MTAPPAPPATAARLRPLPASAWVLYDLANTIYAACLTFLFTPWFTAPERGFGTSGLGLSNTLSMVLAAALVPILGALLDRTGRAHRYLAVTTLLCIAAMAGWSLPGSPAWLLACFFVANVAYNLSLLGYNALLPTVAPDHRTGLLSGIGTGLGYLGTILVLVLLPVGSAGGTDRFLHAALLFLLFALPCLLLVKQGPPPRPKAAGLWRSSLGSLGETLRSLPRHRTLSCFLLANFCLVDVLNTAILFFAGFTGAVFRDLHQSGDLRLFGQHFAADEAGMGSFLVVMGLALNVLALLAGVLLGLCTDRRPLLVMRLSGLALLLALAGGTLFGGRSAEGYLLTLVLLGAIGLAGIWTAGRKIVLRLAPPDRVGEFFGLYGITMKLSVVGSAVYGLVADRAGARPAMLVQAVPLVLGLLLLARVRLPAAAEAS